MYDSIQVWWDIVKKYIRSLAKNVSIYLKRKEVERSEELEAKLNILNNCNVDTGNHVHNEINAIKKELFDIYVRVLF